MHKENVNNKIQSKTKIACTNSNSLMKITGFQAHTIKRNVLAGLHSISMVIVYTNVLLKLALTFYFNCIFVALLRQ